MEKNRKKEWKKKTDNEWKSVGGGGGGGSNGDGDGGGGGRTKEKTNRIASQLRLETIVHTRLSFFGAQPVSITR